MTLPPPSHPRYKSLLDRERLVEGFKNGLVAPEGLIAHGRGEAFDYLLGEITTSEGEAACQAAATYLVQAERPVLSVNGNAAALVGKDLVDLAFSCNAQLEVSLFYWTQERVAHIVEELHSLGAAKVLGSQPDAEIPGLDHPRGRCSREGIFSADVVFVPLEDGDRVEALVAMGKRVIALDLNPLSRSAQAARVTIVDNIVRAVPILIQFVNEIQKGAHRSQGDAFDNKRNLDRVLQRIRGERL